MADSSNPREREEAVHCQQGTALHSDSDSPSVKVAQAFKDRSELGNTHSISREPFWGRSTGSSIGGGWTGTHLQRTTCTPSGVERPDVSPLMSTLLDAAHLGHASRHLLHPVTPTYSMFSWRAQQASHMHRIATSRAPSSCSRCSSSSSSSVVAKHGGSYSGSASGPLALRQQHRRGTTASRLSTWTATGSKTVQQSHDHTGQGPASQANHCNSFGKPGALIVPQTPQQASATRSPVSNASHHVRSLSAGPSMLGGAAEAWSGWDTADSAASLSDVAAGYPGVQMLNARMASQVEVTCEYDAHFQQADLLGQHGPSIRPLAHGMIGPVAFLFRWYAKRVTQFAQGGPSPEDLKDAPPMPPPEAVRPAALASAGKTSAGRRLNMGPDPVINCEEVLDLLEDFEVVPRQLFRRDVVQLFKVVAAIKADPPGSLARSAILPPELRYPQFCDLLIRLALAAAARSHTGSAPGSNLPQHPVWAPVEAAAAAAAAAAAREAAGLDTSGADGDCDFEQEPGSSTLPGIPRSTTTTVVPSAPLFSTTSVPAPGSLPLRVADSRAAGVAWVAAALKSMLDALELNHPTMAALRHKLDALARTASDRAARNKRHRWMHIAASSSEKGALDMLDALGPIPGLDGWNVRSLSGPPSWLKNLLLGSEQGLSRGYSPAWRAFKEPALNLGRVQPGEVRCCRVVLRNRGSGNLFLSPDTTSAPWVSATFSEGPLAPGMPRVVDVSLTFAAAGEYFGELRVLVHSPAADTVAGSSGEARSTRGTGMGGRQPHTGVHMQAAGEALSELTHEHPVPGLPARCNDVGRSAQPDASHGTQSAASTAVASTAGVLQHRKHTQVVAVPIYALVGMAGDGSAAPKSKGARSAFAAKAAASLVADSCRPQSRQTAHRLRALSLSLPSFSDAGVTTQSMPQAPLATGTA